MYFPSAFTLDPTLFRPFELGIKDDLFEQSTISHRRIGAALRSYCDSLNYLRASTEGAVRQHLAGSASGSVTATEARHAGRLWSAIPKKERNSGPQVSTAPVSAFLFKIEQSGRGVTC